MSGCTQGDKAGPGVTIVVLTYGDFGGLERTLRSVIGQSYPAEAVIVSDDASGKAFPSKLQERFSDVCFRTNETNLGTVAHMNAAALSIESKYIKFLAGGDAFSDPNALGALVCFAEKSNTPAVTSQSIICTGKLDRRLYSFPGRRARLLSRSSGELFRKLSLSNLISAPGTLFCRSFFTRLGGFDESYRLLEDWPAWLRLAREGYSIPFLDRVTCLHGVGGISSENLDAYHTPRLKEDMLLCYEKEILPYLNKFSPGEIRRIQYGCDVVRGISHEELMGKYGWLERKATWKRGVKQWLLRV